MANSLLMKFQSLNVLNNVVKPALAYQSVRTTIRKHWDPKFKKLRRLKVQKIKLPDFEKDRNTDEMTPQQMRKKMKEKGLLPPRPWMERSVYISCTGGVFEAYVPPEGDGKMSSITPTGAKQKLQFLEKRSKSMMALRKVKSFDDDFTTEQFVEEAQKIYVRAHEALCSNDVERLRDVVTEKAFPEFRYNSFNKTIRWKFLKSLEPPRVVHARCTDVVTKENIFAQVTVRFHTQQHLAIYDRFGRLMHGSEILAKDVLEYIVFEKHIANVYGKWRVHEKIVPEWMPPPEPARKTFVETPLEELETEPKQDAKAEEKQTPAAVEGQSSGQLAAA